MLDAIKKLKGLESSGLADAMLNEMGTLSRTGDVRSLKDYNRIAKLVRRNVAKAYEIGFQRGWECALDRAIELLKRDSKHVQVPR